MSEKKEPISKFKTFVGLLKFIMIFVILYFAQYFVNQGLVSKTFFAEYFKLNKLIQLEITIYDCAHSFGKGPYAQYRWYQNFYQVRNHWNISRSILIPVGRLLVTFIEEIRYTWLSDDADLPLAAGTFTDSLHCLWKNDQFMIKQMKENFWDN